ncbi:hypothetical protein TWF506_011356 [Arthrobotrys conoides]|uniref:PIN domain-containing protein n=1 Tax=Arthrobotrys conoides TaxID=74498 RepID=A0AAN8RUN7_9PEZI
MIITGRLGNIILDTNIVSPILDNKPLHEWLVRVMKESSLAVFQYNVMEHLTSRKVGTRMSYKDILRSLEARNITVLNGPFASSESSNLSFEILQMAHQARFTMPDSAKRFEDALSKAQQRMACEAHVNQYSFLTADKEFYNFFKAILNEKNITVYSAEEDDLKGPGV